jgi:hypothetical protein
MPKCPVEILVCQVSYFVSAKISSICVDASIRCQPARWIFYPSLVARPQVYCFPIGRKFFTSRIGSWPLAFRAVASRSLKQILLVGKNGLSGIYSSNDLGNLVKFPIPQVFSSSYYDPQVISSSYYDSTGSFLLIL